MKCGSALTPQGGLIANPTTSSLSDLNAETLVHFPKDTVAIASSGPDRGASQQRSVGASASSIVGSAAEFQLGDTLGGRYRLLKLLGQGGMGTVYQALDIELDRPVALKLVRPELASQPDLILRFKNELILARQITHRNVVRIFDIFVSEGAKFMTMEFVEGIDLHQRISLHGRLPVDEAVATFRQSLLGLQAAHNEGVIHRDLKPHNIVVDPQGRAVLMDFGIASSAETSGMTRTGMLMGTPYYMAPEQALGQKADARSDLFSMGVIFFEMLTGIPPYQASSSIQTLVKRTTRKAPSVLEFNPEVPAYLAGIVARCLEIGLHQRYPTAAAILADLDQQKASAPGDTHYDGAGFGVLALQPNSSFGNRYLIESVLGQGGMGTVYKARDLELDRSVALKLVRPELANKPASFEKLKQEILLASSISHRNILRIHDLGEVDGLKFVSMAYVDGPDLSVTLSSGRLPIDRAMDYAIQICEALEAAHGENVVHRDLKPRNILIGKDERAYVTDFGIAFSLAAEGVTDSFGTPEYMAPEQVENKTLDHRVDLYAFGLILYQMVTGALPFQADTTIQTLFQRVTVAPRNPRILNPELPDSLVTSS
jgi:serine/threonine protein kinase